MDVVWAAVVPWAIAAAKVVGAALLVSVAFHVAFRHRKPRLVLRQFSSGLVAHVIDGDAGPAFVHKEMFLEADGSYFRHGVSLEDAETRDGRHVPLVLDVGANVGFFARQVLARCPTVDIVCYEPIPILAEAARRNTARVLNGAAYAQHVTVHQVGLSDEAHDSVPLTCFPGFSATSCVDTKAIHSGAATGTVAGMLIAGAHDLAWAGLVPQWASAAARAIFSVPVVAPLAVAVILPVFVWGLHLRNCVKGLHNFTVGCPLRRLDAMLAADGLAGRPIDMLKVDIEGAEWAMLQGMSDHNWAAVRQAVIEVHDVDGRLAKLQALLRAKGFRHIVVGTEEMESHKILGIYTVFARKDAPRS